MRGLLLYLVLPNLVFFLIGREIFIRRALVNSDYLLLWIASCYVSRKATILLYSGLMALDLILSTESIYNYSTVEVIIAAREILEFDPAVFYSFAAMGLLLLAIVAHGAPRTQRRLGPPVSKQIQIMLGLAVLWSAGATVARSHDLPNGFLEKFGDSAILASAVTETAVASFGLATGPHGSQIYIPAPGAATSSVARDLSLQGTSLAPYDIVLILVESQGLLNSASDMRRVLAPLLGPAIQARYKINTGKVRFYGATMFGELRTLCGIYLPHAVPQDLPGLDRCLPNKLRERGYETVSYHGFYKWFYQRMLWYPNLGFEKSYFADELMPLAPPSGKCGVAFKNICDLWIADQIDHELATPDRKRKFIYWLTLNSHLPVDSGLAGESAFDCENTRTLREERGPCELARIHNRLYARIAQLALNSALPVRFIIVGDHMPPFAALAERALYDGDKVPFVELIPKSASQMGGRP